MSLFGNAMNFFSFHIYYLQIINLLNRLFHQQYVCDLSVYDRRLQKFKAFLLCVLKTNKAQRNEIIMSTKETIQLYLENVLQKAKIVYHQRLQ